MKNANNVFKFFAVHTIYYQQMTGGESLPVLGREVHSFLTWTLWYRVNKFLFIRRPSLRPSLN